MTPQERIDHITDRLTPLLGVPNIHPSDIVVYLPPADSHVNRSPVIYALGRKLITVDSATVASAGGSGTPLMMAEKGQRAYSRFCRVSTGVCLICRSQKCRSIRP